MDPEILKGLRPWLDLLGTGVTTPAARRFLETSAFTRDVVDDATYWECRPDGIVVLEEAGTIQAIFLYSGFYEDFSSFEGPVPSPIALGETRPNIRDRLGEPSRSGEGKLEAAISWDRYDFDAGYYLHFTYLQPRGELALLTLGFEAER